MRWFRCPAFCIASLITLALLLNGCVAPSPQAAVPSPQVIMQGDTPGKEEVQPIELDNCNGKGDAKRIEQRSRSIESTISAEIAAKFGASAEVLSAEVQAVVGAAMKWGSERSTSIELVAPPGTRMAFQLVWIGDEQLGIVQNLRASNIPIAFRSFKPTDVRIKSQYDIGCPPTPSVQRPVATPESRSVAPVLSPTVWPATQPVPPGTVVSPSTVASPSIPSRPSGITISSGGTFSPSGNWVWICTGDFTITRPDRTNVALYDSSPEATGLVVVLEQGSQVIVNAPWGGYCEPFAQADRNAGIARKISDMLSAGCGSSCKSVNVKELDKNGNILNDYWKP